MSTTDNSKHLPWEGPDELYENRQAGLAAAAHEQGCIATPLKPYRISLTVKPQLPHREGIKKVFAAMTYADRPLEAFPKLTKALLPRTARITGVCDAIERHHGPLREAFYTCVGLEVMHRESQVMTGIMLNLIERGIVALPIHDAVVVEKQHAGEVEDVMLGMFRQHAGVEGKVEYE